MTLETAADEGIRRRVLDLAAIRKPRAPTPSPGKRYSGATPWVRALWSEIKGWREAGWHWDEVAALFNDGSVPLAGDRRWTAAVLRRTFSRERIRREGRHPVSQAAAQTGVAADPAVPTQKFIGFAAEGGAALNQHHPPMDVRAPGKRRTLTDLVRPL